MDKAFGEPPADGQSQTPSGGLTWTLLTPSCGAALFIPVSHLKASPARALQSNPPPLSPPIPAEPLRKRTLPALGPTSAPSREAGGRGQREEMLGGAVQCHGCRCNRMCARAQLRPACLALKWTATRSLFVEKASSAKCFVWAAQERGSRGTLKRLPTVLLVWYQQWPGCHLQ